MRRVVALIGMVTTASAADGQAPLRVTASLDGRTAHYAIRVQHAVQRGIHNDFTIDKPFGAVITSAKVHVDGHDHALALDSRDRVDAMWGDLTTTKPGAPPWVVTIHDDVIAIAAPHAATVTLDLELDATTCFTNDRRYADLPAGWNPPDVHVQTKLDATCAKNFARAVWWPVTEAKHAPARIATPGQRLDLEDGHYAHAEVALAAKLSDVPNDLSTVFVVDASRSVTGDDLAAMQHVIESYARHAPNSQIQIVAYARAARSLLPRWTNARALPRHLFDTLELANGSNADAGLDAAGTWLNRVTGTRRVVLFDDELLPDRVSGIAPAKLKELLPTGTLVHVVGLGNRADAQAFVRSDDISFAPLAASTEGFAAQLWSGWAGAPQTFDAEELVRPIALDHVTVATPGWDKAVFDSADGCLDPRVNERMAEGSGCEVWAKADRAGASFTLDGLLWNHPIHREIVLAVDHQGLARAITAGTSYADDGVQFAAHAVTRKWSLTVSWGGTGSYDDEPYSGGASGWGCGCGGPFGTIGHGTAGKIGMRTSRDVDQQVSAAVAKCHADTATIELELTQSEIVGVTVTADPEHRDCLSEAVWGLALVRNDPVNHERVVVRI